MRLRERFPGGRGDEPLDPQIERELAVIDAALAGEPVDADFDRVATLARDLRDERELPTPEFSARLDRWAAEGFPSGREPDPRPTTGASPLAGLRERLAAIPGRRILAPAGAGATLLVVIAVGVSQIPSGTVEHDDDGGMSATSGGDSGPAAVGETARGVQEQARDDAAAVQGRLESNAGAAAEFGALSQADALGDRRASDIPFAQRKIARRVDLKLATAPEKFRAAANGVIDVVDDHSGFFTESSVSGGDPDVKHARMGQARFELRIPAAELSSALAALSDLGNVVSRTDGAVDVTGRVLSTRQEIADYEATRQRLLTELETAYTITEQEAIERQLDIVEANLAAAEEELGDLQKRVQLVPVTVTITADRAIDEDGEEGAWSIGDAFDDAGRVLEVVAGVLVVSAAVLIPVGLLVLLAWLAAREIARRRRESALD
jgi:hypothetical protein